MKFKTNSKVGNLESKIERIRTRFGSLIMLFLIVLIASSCDNDDEQPEIPESVGNIVISEVSPAGKKYVELFNAGSASTDVSSYWLCLGPGQYFRVGDLEATLGTASIASGNFLVVRVPNLSDESGGVGLYTNNEDFSSSDNIMSFVQYGAAGSARESVAVAAEIWSANEFVPTPIVGNSIEFDGQGTSASNWHQAYPSFGIENRIQALKSTIAITEVDYANLKQVEIRNNTTETVDVSNYWLCLGPGNYRQISALTVVNGSTNLNPGAHLVITFDLLGDSSDGLGLYRTNAFASSDAIVDFVQYGAAGSPREGVAVGAGVWTSGEFINTSNLQSGTTLSYDGGGVSESDWNSSSSTLGDIN